MAVRLAAVGGWVLALAPLRFEPSREWLRLHDCPPGTRPSPKDVLQRIAPDDRLELERRLRRCAREGLAFEMVIATRTFSGREVHMRLIAEPHQDAEGRVTSIHGACQDVTSQVEREGELAEHRSRLEELVDQRTRDLRTFSYALAHDLRAPIAAMSGFSKVAVERLQSRNGEGVTHYLQRIVANAERAEALIEGILALIGAVQAPLHKREVDLTAMALQAMEHLRAQHPQRVVKIVIDPDLRAHGDPRLLLSVVDNLLSNAWKYTEARPLARIEVGEVNGAYFVRDNGVGFDAADAQLLFEPLRRLPNSHGVRGTGVGLATASRIVDRHGGRMWAEAAPDQGATFWFTLPS